jgi:predicted MFS family arabinose efflux permease
MAVAAQDWWHLAPALGLVAIGALGYPTVSRAIAETARPEQRARALALVYGVGGNLAMILAPALGGSVAGRLGLRWVFVAALVIELASLACYAGLRLPAARRGTGAEVSYRAVLACRPILALSVFLLLANLVWMTGFALLPNYLQDERGLSVGAIGWLASVTACGGMLLLVASTRSRRRTQPLDAILIALVGAPPALALLAGAEQVWVLAVASFMGGGCGFSGRWSMARLGALRPSTCAYARSPFRRSWAAWA